MKFFGILIFAISVALAYAKQYEVPNSYYDNLSKEDFCTIENGGKTFNITYELNNGGHKDCTLNICHPKER